MMKKSMALCLIIALVACFAVVGCGQKNEPAAGDAKKDEVIELKFHHFDPPTCVAGKFFADWSKQIEDKTNGKVKITVYPSSTLGGPRDGYDMVTTGVCDIAWGFVGLFPGQFPMTEVIGLPMMGTDSAKVACESIWDLYENTDYLKNEYKDVKVLFIHTHGDVPVSLKGKEVSKVEDLKGLKLRTPSGPPLEFAKAYGANPINMPSSQIYESMEKGVIDGCTIDWHALDAFKIYELIDVAYDIHAYKAPFWVVMNKDVWDKLPDDVKAVFDELGGANAAAAIGAKFDEADKIGQKDILDAGGKIVKPTEKDVAKLQDNAKIVWEKWVKDNAAKGLPAQEVLDKTLEIIEKHNKANK